MKMQHSRNQEDANLKKYMKRNLWLPRVAEPVREVITSPDEEILQDHGIVESQEPPQMTISHKRKPT
jgi:hypothetical protein